MKFSKSCFCLLIMLLITPIYLLALEQKLFENKEQECHYEQLIREFRCVTCPNQSISDSQAPIATAMREDIYERIKQGETAAAIRQTLVNQYGEYVLYQPPLKEYTWLLWLGPFVMLFIGLWIWVKHFK